jgi:hypothetical protein
MNRRFLPRAAFAAFLASLVPIVWCPTASAAPAAAPAAACESRTSGGDHREIRCPLAGGKAVRTYHFRANFSGGHDDTSARMSGTLDDRPLPCAAGSKMSLFGEDGDVGLECRFAVPVGEPDAHLLVMTILWSHAQWVDFALVPE